MPTAAAPLGEKEVADLLGVKRETVHQWRWRGRMPDPDYEVNGLPAWRFSTIDRWARETGRLTDEPAAVEA